MMENQPAYGQEDEIDLVALTFTLLRKYRQILAAALACAIIFGAAAGCMGRLLSAFRKHLRTDSNCTAESAEMQGYKRIFRLFAAKFSFHSQQKAASPGGHRPAWAF